eukprot:TRINITY_DN18_c0_g1_i23.p1 TRINITY_DN18_c0_g1~~TRINITY_DN18_c0_g1_i23.p1  ORF type:complete len:285 (+),score=-53.29 TRINITY_DN18_c0_g1_i23:757-1611(+)
MLHRLCGPPSIPLSFIVANVLPRWITQCFRSVADYVSPTTSNHRLRRGLPGYLILFAPHAFVHQRQLQLSKLPSQSVFCVISMHFTATQHIPPTSTKFKTISINGSFTVELQDFTTDLIVRLRTLQTQQIRITLASSVLPRLLARSQPVLLLSLTSNDAVINYNTFLTTESTLQPEGLLHTRGMAASGLRPLCNIPHCCLPQESGPCLSSSVTDHPLKPVMRHSLGRPLPHQLTDTIQADLRAINISLANFCSKGIQGVSRRFHLLSPSLRHVTYTLLTRAPLS